MLTPDGRGDPRRVALRPPLPPPHDPRRRLRRAPQAGARRAARAGRRRGPRRRARAEHAIEVEELLGYHLEQAHRYRAELGPLDAHAVDLGRRARRCSGRPARRVADARATCRPPPTCCAAPRAALPADDPAAAPPPGAGGRGADGDGRLRRGRRDARASARRSAEAVERSDGARRDRRPRARARGVPHRRPAGTSDAVAAEAERGVEPPSEAGGRRRGPRPGVAPGAPTSRLTRCQWGAAERAAGAMIDHARRAGETLMVDARPAGARHLHPLRPHRGARGDRTVRGDPRRRGRRSPRHRPHRARPSPTCSPCAATSRPPASRTAARAPTSRSSGGISTPPWCRSTRARSRCSPGDPAAAEAELRRDYEALRGWASATTSRPPPRSSPRRSTARAGSTRPSRSRATSREIAAEDDVVTQVVWRSVAGKVLARRGLHADGEAMCREAVGLIEVDRRPQHPRGRARRPGRGAVVGGPGGPTAARSCCGRSSSTTRRATRSRAAAPARS